MNICQVKDRQQNLRDRNRNVIWQIINDYIYNDAQLFFFKGPCTGNQQSLAHSRLWDAVVGFLHVFAHMQMKLSQVCIEKHHYNCQG